MLCIIMLRAVVLNVVMLSVILSVVMLTVVMLSAVMLYIITLSNVMSCALNLECHFVMCNYAEYHHAVCHALINYPEFLCEESRHTVCHYEE
jgi:hypothetical protein